MYALRHAEEDNQSDAHDKKDSSRDETSGREKVGPFCLDAA